MMNCIIVDVGERLNRSLVRLCEKIEDLQVIATCKTGTEALKALHRSKIDLMILDQIDPKDESWGDVTSDEKMPPVIMIGHPGTSIIESLGIFPADFISRPVSQGRLETAVKRARRRSRIMKPVRRGPELSVRENNKIIRIPYPDILYMTYGDDGSEIHTLDGIRLVQESLPEMLDMLEDERFFKVSRNYIVNVAKISEVFDTGLVIGGVTIPISRAKRPVLDARRASI